MKKTIFLLLIFLLCLQCAVIPLTANTVNAVCDNNCAVSVANADVIDDVLDLFTGAANTNTSAVIDEEVYLGGYPIGITIDGEGVTVIGLNEFVGADGKLCCPAMNAGITINDVVV